MRANGNVKPKSPKCMQPKAFVLSVLVTLLSVLGTPVKAQSFAPPPVRETIDDNGVDLLRGNLVVEDDVMSIGADQGITYKRIWRGNGWSNNIDAALQKGGTTFIVSFNGRSDRFTQSGSSFTSTEGNGASLTFNSSANVYTYTARDGAQVSFNKTAANSINAALGIEGLASTISSPDGNQLNISY